jgi:hypothetical protein
MPGFVLPKEFDTSGVKTPKFEPALDPAYFQAPMAKALSQYMAGGNETTPIPDIGSIMQEPVADPNIMGFGGSESTTAMKDAYAGRIANIGALVGALKEKTAAMRAPGQVVQDVADAYHKSGQVANERLKAETEAFKLTPEYARIVGAQELYKKMGETHGQLAANKAYTETLDTMPLPRDIQELTGLQTYNQVRLLTGSDSANAISGFVNAVARIKSAGIGAGGQVAAANKVALASLVQTLNTERQVVQGQMTGHLSTQKNLIDRSRNPDAWDSAITGMQNAQGRLQAIDQALNNLSTHLGTQVGVPVAGTPPAPTAGAGAAPTPVSGNRPRSAPVNANPPAPVPTAKTVKVDGKEYPVNSDGTITVGGKNYRVPNRRR